MNLNTEFVNITKKNAKNTKCNTSFRVIAELVTTKDPLILNCGMALIKKSHAYLFQIASKPEYCHFTDQGFLFRERHLRVDEFYSLPTTLKGKSGFAAAHYTETYVKPGSDETITVHVYYGDNLLYIKVKKQIGQENCEWLDETQIEKTAKANAIDAISFYKQIEAEKCARYLNALTEADRAEKNLQRLSRTMSTAAQVQKYLEALAEFDKLIVRVNHYNELEKDCRNQFSADIKEKLHDKLELLKQQADKPASTLPGKPQSESQPEPAASHEPHASATAPKTPVQVIAQDNIDHEYLHIKELSVNLAACLKSLTAKSLAPANKIAQDLRIALLLYTTPKNSKKQSKKKQLQAIEKQLDDVPNALDFALKLLPNIELDTLQELYPLLGCIDQLFFLDSVLGNLLEASRTGNTKDNPNLLAILEWFHQTSPHYKLFITLQSGAIHEHLKG